MAITEKKLQEPVTVGFIALGCPKNIVDSEKMLAEITQANLIVTADSDNADIVVINTCGFIAPAKAEAIEAIRHAVSRKRTGAVKKVIVAGCLSERLGKDLFNHTDGIDAIVGLGQRNNIARIIKKTLCSNEKAVFLGRYPHDVSDNSARLLLTPHHWAYLKISEGCNHKCSFCTIPTIKGRFRSKPEKLIIAEAKELVSSGVMELNIIAQDTAYYGRDFKIKNTLAKLVGKLEEITALKWIRLMYLYPTGIDEELIETVTQSKKVVHYFDIPIQHINDRILNAMRRPDTQKHLRHLIEKLRQAIPDLVLRTTLITGFPGETDQQFDELLEFVKWAKFDALGCFKFYSESGTAAAQMPCHVPNRIKQQRLEEIMLTQQKIAFDKNRNRIGTELTCLVDSVDNTGTGRGRFYGQAPDIDSVCIIENCSVKAGSFLNTKVVASKDYDLLVQQI